MRSFVAILLLMLPSIAEAQCRLALALGLDVSGSVDFSEYRLQYNGLAGALADPEVQDSLFALPEAPVAIAVYEWSSSGFQRVVVDWRVLHGVAELEEVRNQLLARKRERAPAQTGLGRAMLFGQDMINVGPQCWDQTLDISGDGKNNDWPPPKRVKESGEIEGLRINALVVAEDPSGDLSVGELTTYFKERVIQGPDAFVEVALGYSDYAEAMKRKLLRELAVLAIGALDSKTE